MFEKEGVIILAGGSSVRMDIAVKAFLTLEGKPLLRHVVDNALKVSERIVIVIGKNMDKKMFSKILPSGVSIVEDEVVGRGPMVGFISGLKKLEAEYVAVLPCDTPFVNPKVLGYLFEKAFGMDASIPIWSNGYKEALQAVYRSASTLQAAGEALENNEFSMLDMVKRLKKIMYIPVDDIKKIDPDLMTFFNVNTAKDFDEAVKYVEKSKIQ